MKELIRECGEILSLMVFGGLIVLFFELFFLWI